MTKQGFASAETKSETDGYWFDTTFMADHPQKTRFRHILIGFYQNISPTLYCFTHLKTHSL